MRTWSDDKSDANYPAQSSGALDDFLNANGPLSITIETSVPSPDKTASGMSCPASVDSTSLLPDPDTDPKDASPEYPVTNRESHDNLSCQSQTLLWIKIESSNAQAPVLFSIPVSTVLQREVEMQAAARANHIGKDRWTCSRIFRMWKSQCARQQQRQQHLRAENKNRTQGPEVNPSNAPGEIFLRLTPEVSLQNSNSSCRLFRWKPWLTTCISSYYNTGQLRIPDECDGDDVLLTLEYFGILAASPDDFVFDTTHAYIRTQAWSRYFNHRAILAEFLLEAYDDVEIKESNHNQRKHNMQSTTRFPDTLSWVLLEEWEEESVVKDAFYVTGKRTFSPSAKSEKPLCHRKETGRMRIVKKIGGLYGLFFGRVEESRGYAKCEEYEEGTEVNILSKDMPSRMRQDFCGYLKQSLPPWTSVQFDIELVEVAPICTTAEYSSGSRIESRPVIRIKDHHRHNTAPILNNERDGYCTDQTKSMQQNTTTSNSPSGVEHGLSLVSFGKVSNSLESNKIENSDQHNRNSLVGYLHDINGSTTILDTVTANSRPESTEIGSFSKMQQSHKPVADVNMDFGDLRSVTSVLSEPVVDDQGIVDKMHATKPMADENNKKICKGGSTALVVAKKIVQERSERENQTNNVVDMEKSNNPSTVFSSSETRRDSFEQMIQGPPRATRKLRNPPPWDKNQMNADDAEEVRNYVTASEIIHDNRSSRSDLRASEVKSTVQSDASEWDDDNTDTTYKRAPTETHRNWGHLLASMCEAMIPASSSSSLPSSPIRHFHSNSSKDMLSTDLRRDDESRRNENQPRSVGIIDQAMKFGNDLSSQLDELMRKAYNENTYDGCHMSGGKSLTPVMEEIPGVLSIDTNEELTLASCLTSSVIGQPQNIDPFEESDKIRNKQWQPLSREMRIALPSTSPNRITDEKRGSWLSQENRDVSRKKEKPGLFPMRNTVSKAGRSLHNSDEANRASSLTGTKFADVYSSSEYSKENRYSRKENRFYS